MNLSFEVNPEVITALKEGKPVVALESTIISHGMPYPENVATALAAEQLIRNEGAVPATIAIIKGVFKVGLTPDEITYLGQQGLAVTKVSRLDIPIVIARKGDGATTVAATMWAAAKAGIRVFATGGIGGVHRGATETMDISADLEELAQTPVAVVCAGAKSILDLGLTMEYLETKGVPVIGYQTDVLPAFYTRESDFNVNVRCDTPDEIANIMAVKLGLNMPGGLLVTNPIPHEYSMNRHDIDYVIQQAIKEMQLKGIKGKETTPFLLAKVKSLTGGKSLESNIQLVYNNCRLAAQMAIALAALETRK